MNAAVSIREVDIAYGPVKVVADLNLEIAPGEFIVLLGPSGCGKSTLLNAIAGLTEISDGEIWISGRNATWDEPKDRGIGMVFQSYALYPRMSVLDNLSFGLRVAGMPKPQITDRVTRAAEILHLEPLLSRRPSDLSGGQRQRVAIGRALVRDVDVFLFDEPLSDLDAKLRAELRVEIKRLHQQLGNTMIYVTHDQVEAMTLADRIVVMRDGVIQQLGTPAEIYHEPANLFVAGFIGSPPMNMIEGIVRHRGAQPVLGTGDVEIALDRVAGSSNSTDGQRIVLGVRPEQITLRANDPSGSTNQGTISVVEPMGPDTIVWLCWNGLTLGARMVGDFPGKAGDPVGLELDLQQASMFDAQTGQRLRTG
jgi:multiple sugar transport system ATP-binding protein